MADNDKFEDEYEFSDLDTLNPEMGQSDAETKQSEFSSSYQSTDRLNAKNMILIGIGALVLIWILYKILTGLFGGTSTPVKAPVMAIPAAPTQTKPIEKTPVIVTPNVPTQVEEALKQRISTLDINQQSLQSEVSATTDKIDGLSTRVNELSQQMVQLNQMMTQLSQQLEQQSQELAHLKVRKKPKIVKHVVRHVFKPISYTIQAVIPGRAWLIASNGSTITVRRNTNIAGYGVVKLIDPIQGKVITSSGKVIRFSQQDS